VRRVIATLAAVAFASGGASAHATPSARLIYSRARGAESCPEEEALRRAVALRVGYDPFFAWAKKTIVARMARISPRAFVASVDLIDENGMEHGARALHTEGECGELLDAVALAIAIAIDPRSLMPRSTAPDAPPPPPTNAPHAAAPPSPATPLPEPQFAAESSPPLPLIFEGSAGAVASVGVAPLPAAGLALGVSVRSRRVSLAAEGRIDAPVSAGATGGGSIVSWLATAALIPCAHALPLFVCALGEAGAIQASSEGIADQRSQSVLWLAVGGRFGVLLPLQGDTLLRVRADVVGNLNPRTFQLNGRDQWTLPPAAGSFGADVVVHFR
jgi:hypothetical protein